ncbi:MAG: PP2C family serine/threonine-protein phosphatase [Candidatus Symbiobacter sp.]|nr:PP2C family serine/threonine-protein phosphatase [Candidatus Symbiobacter sp.]
MVSAPDPAPPADNPRENQAGWQVAAAKQVGRTHIYLNRGCEDYCGHDQVAGGIVLAVVSDGAGSVPFAAAGSQTLCESLLSTMRQFFAQGGQGSTQGGQGSTQGGGGNGNQDHGQALAAQIDRAVILGWIEQARQDLQAKAEQTLSPLNHYAATLLLVVAGPQDAVIVQLGDGATVVAVDAHETEWHCVHWPQHGPFLNTTYFVTEDDYAEHLQIEFYPHPLTALAMFSDGLERLLLSEQSRSPHAPFFTKIFAQFRHCQRSQTAASPGPIMEKILADLLDSREVNDRTDDDKTLLLIMR